jgi:hypothetical protein
MGVSGSGAMVILMIAAQSGVPLGDPGSAPEKPPAAGTLLHPLRIELDQAPPGWRLARLEVRLDGTLLAEQSLEPQPATEDPLATSPEAAGVREIWSGEVPAGEHELTAVVVLQGRAQPQDVPRETRVERARRFRAGPSEAMALLIQVPAGKGGLRLDFGQRVSAGPAAADPPSPSSPCACR